LPPAHHRFDHRSLAGFCQNSRISFLEVQRLDSDSIPSFLAGLALDLLLVYAGTVPRSIEGANLRRGTITVGGDLSSGAAGAEGSLVALHTTLCLPNGKCTSLQQATLVLEPFDSSHSFRLKLDLLARDLLVASVQDVCEGDLTGANVPAGASEGRPAALPDIAPRQFVHPSLPKAQRPAWKLMVRTIAFAPLLLLRNWYRRLTATFPVVILYHHLVSDRPHRMGISTHWFQRHVHYLKEHYRVAALPEAIAMLRSGRVDRPTVVLTFDDGYLDNLTNLRAVTEEEGISATLFVCTEHMRSGMEFAHDIRRNERGFFPLNWAQVELLQRSGMTIGSHTRTHFDCGSEDPDALRAEIAGAQDDFVQALGAPTQFFSFPWGNPQNMSAPAVALARRSYGHVFSGCGGVNFPARSGELWPLKRRLHTNHPWELELALQGVLNLEFLGKKPNLEDISA
jgi:peptidoglycan/xylan/chitin deacetylase (PgdA/CDA1 family)